MRYYRLNLRKTRFREFVRISYPKTALAAFAWMPIKLGLFRLPTPIMPRPDSISETFVDEREIPEQARTVILASISRAEALGFLEPTFELMRTRGKVTTGTCVRCRHRDGRFIFQSVFSFNERLSAGEQQILSFFDDGSVVATTNGRPKYDRHPKVAAYFHPGMRLPDLLDAHVRTLANRSATPVFINTREELIRQIDALSDRFFDDMIGRGIFEEVPSDAA